MSAIRLSAATAPGSSTAVAALIAMTFLIAGCGSPVTDKCGGVKCGAGQMCSPATGACVSVVAERDLAPTDDANSPSMDARRSNPDLSEVPDLSDAPDLIVAGSDGGMDDGGALLGCAAPAPLTLVNGKASVKGDTSTGMSATQSVVCGGLGPELVYQITIKATSIITAVVTPGAMSPTYDPLVYLRDVCGDETAAHEIGCKEAGAKGATATLVSGTLAAGTYFLWVDGYAGSQGAYTLDVTVTPSMAARPANDSCQMPTPLMLDANGNASASGDLGGATDDAVGSCGQAGADDVYSIALAQPSTVVVTVTADAATPGYRPVVYIRRVCSSAALADEVACGSASGNSGMATASASNLAAGTYFIWVDSVGFANGKYNLSVTSGSSPPNDTCALPTPISFVNGHASFSSNTNFAAADTSSANCGGIGNDVVYTFTTMTTQSLVAVVTPSNSPSYQPVVYVRNACADDTAPAELGCNAAGMGGTAAMLSVGYLPAGTYYLWVDGISGTQGTADVSVTLGAPLAAEGCSNPGALTFVNNVATQSTDTTNAGNDSVGACDFGVGADLVYTFTIKADQKITAVVTVDAGSPTYQPIVYLRPESSPPGAGCADPNNELACDSAMNPGQAATITVGNAPPGVYYVWVDGYGGSSGKATLTVTLDTPVPLPPNAICAGAVALTPGVTVMGDTTTSRNNFGSALSMTCTNLVGPMVGRDLVYSFTPLMSGMVNVTVTPSGNWDPALWVMPTSCGAEGSGCTDIVDFGGPGTAEVLPVTVTAMTPYYFVVDSAFNSEFGAFSIAVQ